jgi:hypothetical protein
MMVRKNPNWKEKRVSDQIIKQRIPFKLQVVNCHGSNFWLVLSFFARQRVHNFRTSLIMKFESLTIQNIKFEWEVLNRLFYVLHILINYPITAEKWVKNIIWLLLYDKSQFLENIERFLFVLTNWLQFQKLIS